MNEPTLNCTVIDVNPTTIQLTGDEFVLVRHYSTASAAMIPEAHGGSSINLDTCIIRNAGNTVYGLQATFENVYDGTFFFSCEDSEYRVATGTVTRPMVDYIKLTCNASDVKIDGSGQANFYCSGSFFNGSFGAVANTIVLAMVRYRTMNGSWVDYIPLTFIITGNSYFATASVTGLDYKESYCFEYIVQDKLMTVSASQDNVVSTPLFHWGENDVTFEVPVVFNESVRLQEGVDSIRVKNNVNFGTTNENVISYKDDTIYLYTKNLSLFTNSISNNGFSVCFSQYGTWTPTLSCSGLYSIRSGWYSKSGNVVTVGFRIMMTCNSGYESSNVVISGLPYIPTQASSGGGMCSGAIIQTNKNFQCFVAETDGTITTRAQSCDSTSGTSLETSASACKYPSAAELTLSGTIVYMIA